MDRLSDMSHSILQKPADVLYENSHLQQKFNQVQLNNVHD